MPRPTRGLGVTSGLDPGVARELAARCQDLGYHSLWCNDEADAPGLESLAHFAAGAPGLQLGVGALPLHRYEPARIAAEIDRLSLDPSKLWIAIGSGSLRPQIAVVEQAVAALRELLPDGPRIVVAAMRPRLSRLGGKVADGVLLNWMLPDQINRARGWVSEGAAQAERSGPPVASYVRVAVGPGALKRLRDEEGFYRTVNEGHRRHFEAMGVEVGSVGVAGTGQAAVQEELRPYQAVLDVPIVRVLADRDLMALTAVADAAAPQSTSAS